MLRGERVNTHLKVLGILTERKKVKASGPSRASHRATRPGHGVLWINHPPDHKVNGRASKSRSLGHSGHVRRRRLVATYAPITRLRVQVGIARRV